MSSKVRTVRGELRECESRRGLRDELVQPARAYQEAKVQSSRAFSSIPVAKTRESHNDFGFITSLAFA